MMTIAMRLPDTLSSERETLQEIEKNTLFDLLNKVLEDIENYRTDEGNALEKDFIKRIALIEDLLRSVVKTDPERN